MDETSLVQNFGPNVIHFVVGRNKASQRRPGVQNEPRGVPEASRRRPRVSKKLPEGAK